MNNVATSTATLRHNFEVLFKERTLECWGQGVGAVVGVLLGTEEMQCQHPEAKELIEMSLQFCHLL